jgi:hypothetical protein
VPAQLQLEDRGYSLTGISRSELIHRIATAANFEVGDEDTKIRTLGDRIVGEMTGRIVIKIASKIAGKVVSRIASKIVSEIVCKIVGKRIGAIVKRIVGRQCKSTQAHRWTC